jgi:hypothetical protein
MTMLLGGEKDRWEEQVSTLEVALTAGGSLGTSTRPTLNLLLLLLLLLLLIIASA